MSRYYNPVDGRHIPNPVLRTFEWAGRAHEEAPTYNGREQVCRYEGKQWVLELNTENQVSGDWEAAQEKEALIQAKIREMAEAELVAEGKLEAAK